MTGGTVLIVEDDEDFRETLRLWLDDDRWTVREARTGSAALTQLDADVDVLTIDRQMPGATVATVLDQMGETGFDGNVVVVSAYEPDRFLRATAVDTYLTKPVSREAFLNAVGRNVDSPTKDSGL